MMPRFAKGGTTIAQVAEAAGVSRATVSRVMNGQSNVDSDMAERVRAVAAELQYRPSTMARGLSLGRTNSIALVVPDLGNPMFQQILRGAVAAAEPFGFRFLVAETAEHADAEAEIALEARLRCDALILAAPRSTEAALRELLPQVEPVVLINREIPGLDVPAVRVDYGAGVHSVVDHLVALGHRELAYVAGPRASASHALRARAFEEARERHSSLRVTTVPCGSTVDDGYRVADEVLATGATGVVAFNDLVAFGLLARLNETGVDVPGDISIAGFDDIELARYATPSLTTAAVPQAELGRRAWGLLHQLVAARVGAASAGGTPNRAGTANAAGSPNRGGTGTAAPSAPSGGRLVMPGLVVRSSTGPVPPARRLATPSSDRAGRARTGAPGRRAVWAAAGDGWALNADDQPLTRYVNGEAMPAVHSPRPHLHPLHSLGGVAMTQTTPTDHRHHYGVSMAVPDVNGTTYWGGRTFVRGQGPTLLSNQGRQRTVSAEVVDDGATLSSQVSWTDERGRDQLVEHRRVTGLLLPEVEAWALGWSSRLRAHDSDVTIGSPATSGRPGAGYGGLFWRLPFADETSVLTADGASEARAHGSRSPWIAVVRRHGDAWTTLLLVQPGRVDPWFARVADYVGAGPALAWDTPRRIEAGSSLDVELVAAVVDRRLDATDATDLANFAAARLAATQALPR
jgi:LacI family transcriptional regulator